MDYGSFIGEPRRERRRFYLNTMPHCSGDITRSVVDGFLRCLANGYAATTRHANVSAEATGCWDHAHRNSSGGSPWPSPENEAGKRSKAEQADIAQIGNLYRIESAIKDLAIEDKKRVRLEQSVPILEAFHEWLQ